MRPSRTYLAQRDAAGAWRRLSYAEVYASVRRLGQALLDAGLGPDRPLLILSGNDIEHALLGLAAYHVGIPFAPIAPAYSTISHDFGKLREIVDLLQPGLVFAADGATFAPAIRAVIAPDVPVVVTCNPPDDRRAHFFTDFERTVATDAVEGSIFARRPRHDRQISLHVGDNRFAEGGSSTRNACCVRTRR